MYSYEILPHLKDVLQKLSKKDKQAFDRVIQKIEEVLQCPNIDHYKNLRYDLKDRKRVHIGHFVLVFKGEGDKITFMDYDHHDNIYIK
jgi:mRNA-degrading endonuclease RelE of RelBE toxin-antitoxin system